MVRRVITFTDEMDALLSQVAVSTNKPVSSLVREAVVEYLHEKGFEMSDSTIQWGSKTPTQDNWFSPNRLEMFVLTLQTSFPNVGIALALRAAAKHIGGAIGTRLFEISEIRSKRDIAVALRSEPEIYNALKAFLATIDA